MQIRYLPEFRIWVADASYAEKDAVKKAGFWWHPAVGNCRFDRCKACEAGLVKKWWTFKREAAAKLVGYAADDATRESLQETVRALVGSRAADAEIDVPAPGGLEYRPFQRAGIAYAADRKGTLIADEMGLGKTIQALGLINLKKFSAVLIVVPASLRINWRNEARRWLVEDLSIVTVLTGDEDLASANVVIVNYERIKGEIFDVLMSREWDLIVIDEAHYCKNPKAQRTQRVLGTWNAKEKRKVPGLCDRARNRLFLTGTPILNRPIELHPLLANLDPRQFGHFMRFAKRYCAAVQTRYGWDFTGASNLSELQDRLRASVMVRRLKADVLKELPPKVRQIVELAPNGMSRTLEQERKAWRAMGFDNAEDVDNYNCFRDLTEDMELAAASGDEDAYNAAVARLDSAVKVAFEEMSSYRKSLAVQKIPAVIEHCDNMLENVGKLVIFAHHIEVMDKLKEHYGSKAVMLRGDTKVEDRQVAVDRFQTDDFVRVFIGSIKAAGVGITLTAASNVVFAELDWVPANVSQAEDRCHRIGQAGSVNVQHLVVDGSLDAKLAMVLVAKQAIMDAALDNQSAPITVPEGTGRAPRPPRYPEATQAQRDACRASLRLLAGVCDGALMKDGAGFNKMDTRMGKTLAARTMDRDLTDGEVHLCKRMLPKYHRQIGEDLVKAIKG